MKSRFEPEARGIVLQNLRAGLTLEEAARGAGLPPQTLKNWLTRGRSEIGTEHAAFAVAVDAARDAAAKAPMSEEEFRACLNRAVRAGSVQAMKLWVQLRAEDAAAPVDPFAALDGDGSYIDQLGRLKQRRMSRLDRLDAHQFQQQGDDDEE